MSQIPPPPETPGVSSAPAKARSGFLSRLVRFLGWLTLLLLGGGLTAGGLYLSGWLKPPPAPANASNPSEKSDGSLACLGYADVPHGISSLVPLQAGVVKEVLVKEGDWVKEGAELVRVDDRMQQLRVVEARAGLEAARTGLKQAEEAKRQQQGLIAQQQAVVDAVRFKLAAARKVLEEKKRLLQKILVQPVEVSTAEDQVKELEAMEQGAQAQLKEVKARKVDLAIDRAKAEVEAAQARLEQAQQAQQECVLLAPRPGTVLRLLASVGDAVGGATRQPALQFAPEGPILIRAEVDQEFANRVALNRAVTVCDDTDPKLRWTGTVTRVGRWFAPRRLAPAEGGSVGSPLALECIITLDPSPNPPRINQRVRVLISNTTRAVGSTLGTGTTLLPWNPPAAHKRTAGRREALRKARMS